MSGLALAPAPSSTDSKCKTISWEKKLGFSAIGGAIFILVSLPQVYKLVDWLFGVFKKGLIVNSDTGAPTPLGIFVHAVVFTALIFLTMEPWKDDNVNVLDESLNFNYREVPYIRM